MSITNILFYLENFAQNCDGIPGAYFVGENKGTHNSDWVIADEDEAERFVYNEMGDFESDDRYDPKHEDFMFKANHGEPLGFSKFYDDQEEKYDERHYHRENSDDWLGDE